MFFWGIVGYRLLEIKEIEMEPQATAVSDEQASRFAHLEQHVSQLVQRVSSMLNDHPSHDGQSPEDKLANTLLAHATDAAKLTQQAWRSSPRTRAAAETRGPLLWRCRHCLCDGGGTQIPRRTGSHSAQL